MKKILIILMVLLLVVVIGRAFFAGPQKIKQPIAFNHNLHIETAGLECDNCHRYVRELPRATLPTIEVCSDCHSEEPLGESVEEKKLIEYLVNQQEVPWIRLYKVPDHVYFSHRRHVTIGGLACQECHGNVPELTEPAPYALIPVKMKNCINCHKQHKVSYDCLSCHH